MKVLAAITFNHKIEDRLDKISKNDKTLGNVIQILTAGGRLLVHYIKTTT